MPVVRRQVSQIEISDGGKAHIPSLLDLARTVEHLFGPMISHGFERVLETNIDREAIVCAVDTTGDTSRAVGGIIFDVRDAPVYRVSWLAVDPEYRGCGIGRMLLCCLLQRVYAPAKVVVITFGPDIEEGIPARRLYESFGFSAGAMAERGAEGGTRQIFELRVDA